MRSVCGHGMKTTVDVYNITDQKVARLADNKYEKGSYTVIWNAAGLSTGLYFYRISADREITSGKMLLLEVRSYDLNEINSVTEKASISTLTR